MTLDDQRELHQLRRDVAILRASEGLPLHDTCQRFAFIQQHRQTWPVTTLCRVLRVSPSGFYAWRTRPPNRWAQRREQLLQQIQDIFQNSRRTYGSPRVHAELVARGIPCCQKTVAKIMRRAGLQATIRHKFQITTDSNHKLPVANNLLDRHFAPSRPNQAWVSDIMAVPTLKGWLHLVVVLDLFSRRAIGWSFGRKRTSGLVIAALQMALDERRPPPGLLHHSDRGSQYASHNFQSLLTRHGILCSMSRKGNCWDNAVMESFFGTLKQELLQHHRFADHDEAERAIVDYIGNFYNLRRRHSTLSYLTPAEYEFHHATETTTEN